jgi:hypothetical protein
MKVSKLKDMKGGWFVGDFEPTAYKTKDCEVSYKIHPAGEEWDIHYHHTEIADPLFVEDCHIICVKTPSASDKISVEIK